MVFELGKIERRTRAMLEDLRNAPDGDCLRRALKEQLEATLRDCAAMRREARPAPLLDWGEL